MISRLRGLTACNRSPRSQLSRSLWWAHAGPRSFSTLIKAVFITHVKDLSKAVRLDNHAMIRKGRYLHWKGQINPVAGLGRSPMPGNNSGPISVHPLRGMYSPFSGEGEGGRGWVWRDALETASCGTPCIPLYRIIHAPTVSRNCLSFACW